jgi:hypothetical protein
MLRKTVSLFLVFCFVIGQPMGFSQVVAQLDFSRHSQVAQPALNPASVFRPLHLRYISYQPEQNKFRLLLDRGDNSGISKSALNTSTQKLMEYFFIGLALPNDSFWVNLRPDLKSGMIDSDLAKTDLGKILLEADVNLKKDTAQLTSPATAQGQEYWGKLNKKAAELFGTSNIDIPTIARPWIVPDEIIMRETESGAYVYKATLKVMLEQDYLRGSDTYNFKDERLKQLNEYAAELMRKIIVPGLTRQVNSETKYAGLRQVYYSLILAQWFKQKFAGRYGAYVQLVDSRVVSGLTSKSTWSTDTYYQAYLESIREGEYSMTSAGQKTTQPARRYFGGGIQLSMLPTIASMRAASPIIQPIDMRVAPIKFMGISAMPRVELVRFDRFNALQTIVARTGNMQRVMPVVAADNFLPVNIASPTSILDFGLDAARLGEANLEVAEIDMGEVLPLSAFPSIPTISTDIVKIGAGMRIDTIVAQIKRTLGIISTTTDEKISRLAQWMVNAKSVAIPDNQIPDLLGIPKPEIRAALVRAVNNVAVSSPVVSVGEYSIIAAEIAQLPSTKFSRQAVEEMSAQQIPIIDISTRKAPVVLDKIASVYNRQADRLTIQAFVPVKLMIAEGQKVTVAVPEGAENIVIAMMTFQGRRILLVSPVRSAVRAITELFKSTVPVKVEYVKIMASPALASQINKEELARNIQAVRLDVIPTGSTTVQKVAVVTDGPGAVIVESLGYTRVQPLVAQEPAAALAAASPILDLQTIKSDMVRQLPANIQAIPAERASFLKAELMRMPAEKQVYAKLGVLLDSVAQGNIVVEQGKSVPLSRMTNAAKVSFIQAQSLPVDQQQILALAMDMEMPGVAKISASVIPLASAVNPESVAQIRDLGRDLGGVDLRYMRIVAQPAAGSAGSLSGFSGLDIEVEGAQIKNMVGKGVVPSSQRVKDYAAAVSQGGDSKQISKAFGSLTGILRLQEEQALSTRPELTEAIVLLEARK